MLVLEFGFFKLPFLSISTTTKGYEGKYITGNDQILRITIIFVFFFKLSVKKYNIFLFSYVNLVEFDYLVLTIWITCFQRIISNYFCFQIFWLMLVNNEGIIQESVVRTKLDICVFILNVSLLVRGWISKTAKCIFILVISAWQIPKGNKINLCIVNDFN